MAQARTQHLHLPLLGGWQTLKYLNHLPLPSRCWCRELNESGVRMLSLRVLWFQAVANLPELQVAALTPHLHEFEKQKITFC